MAKIDEICSMEMALCHVRELTGMEVSSSEFERELVAHALPVYAVAPFDASIVAKTRDADGMLMVTPVADMRAGYVTLLQEEIEQLLLGGTAITDIPAWTACDKPYISWSDIQAYRQANHRVVGEFDADPGEWMGESDTYFFSWFVDVNTVSQLRVPRHTVAELVRIFSAQRDASVAVVEGVGADETPPREAVDRNHNDAVIPVKQTRQARELIRGIDKTQALIAFASLVPVKMEKQLSDGKHIFGSDGARVYRGTKGRRHTSLWDPVLLSVGLNERYGVPRIKLNKAFYEHSFLAPWREEWRDTVERLGIV
jgi:hypothetical protein